MNGVSDEERTWAVIALSVKSGAGAGMEGCHNTGVGETGGGTRVFTLITGAFRAKSLVLAGRQFPVHAMGMGAWQSKQLVSNK